MTGHAERALHDEHRPPVSSMSHRTLTGMFWLLSGSGVQALLRVAVIVIMARLLAPADFGLVAGALVFIDFVEVFSDMGLGLVIVQRPELTDKHVRTGFTVSALLGLLFAVGIWFAAPTIASVFRMEGMTTILRVMALVFPVDSLALVASALLQREMQFRRLAGISVVGYVVGYGVVGVTLALVGLGVWALVGAYLAQTLVVSLTLLVRRVREAGRLESPPRGPGRPTIDLPGCEPAQLPARSGMSGPVPGPMMPTAASIPTPK